MKRLDFLDVSSVNVANKGDEASTNWIERHTSCREARQVSSLYFESLSRLARESIITMPMLKDRVYNHRIRIVSVSEGIDSSQANWDLIANFMSWMHEQFLKNLRAAVLRGQEHAILQDWSCGDWCFRYASEPIPGSERGRKGRHSRPRMRVVINPEHAKWVRQIFHWFVGTQWPCDLRVPTPTDCFSDSCLLVRDSVGSGSGSPINAIIGWGVGWQLLGQCHCVVYDVAARG